METEAEQGRLDLEKSRQLRAALKATQDELYAANKGLLDAYREMLDGAGPGPSPAHTESMASAAAASRLAVAESIRYLDEMSEAEIQRGRRMAGVWSPRLRLYVAGA